MKKHLLLFILVCCPIFMLAKGKNEQDKLMSTNVVYHTETKNWGLNFQAMFPIGSNFYIAPDLAYFFPKNEEHSYWDGGYEGYGGYDYPSLTIKQTLQALNLNADFHYPLYIGKKSFVSPFLGFGGYIGFVKTEISDYTGSLSTTGSLFHANMGVAGKFAITNKVFLSAQAKYLRPLQEGDGLFSLTGGAGFFF